MGAMPGGRVGGRKVRIGPRSNVTSSSYNDVNIIGLNLSNNAIDATNDIDIAVGRACDLTLGTMMVLGSALTKRLDANWAVGTNQGGLDTGAIANTTYHVWLICRPDTGVVDVLFSTSATAPTMPTNYTEKRRIGSILRVSAAIVSFRQFGDYFTLNTPVVDRNNAATVTDILILLTAPLGIKVRPLLFGYLLKTAATNTNTVMSFGNGDESTASVEVVQIFNGSTTITEVDRLFVDCFFTNINAEVRFDLLNAGGAIGGAQVITKGWIDKRGVE